MLCFQLNYLLFLIRHVCFKFVISSLQNLNLLVKLGNL